MAHITDRNGTIRMTGSLDEMVWRGRNAAALGNLSKYEKKDMASRKRGESRSDWSGTRTWTDAVKLATNGWSEGVKRLSNLRDELMDRIGEVLPEPAYIMDVTGFDVDVGAYLAGDPECMVSTTQQPGRDRHIHIMVNVATAHHRSPESMMMRGLMAAGVVDALEQMGHTVTLDVVILLEGHDDKDRFAQVVNVKRPSEPLDLERVVYSCAHPSMLRRLTFAVLESLDSAQRLRMNVLSGYGRVSDEPSMFFPESEQPDLYIGNAMNADTLAEVADQVIKYLRDAGVVSDT